MATQEKYLSELRRAGVLDDRGVVQKNRLTASSAQLNAWCYALSWQFSEDNVQTVVVKADDALGFAQFMANYLSGKRTVYCVGAWPVERKVLIADRAMTIKLGALVNHRRAGPGQEFDLVMGNELLIRHGPDLTIRPEDIELVNGRRVLVVQDRITTGQTTGRVIEAVLRAGGDVIGVAALIKQGNVTLEQVNVPRLVCLMNLDEQVGA